MTAASKRHTYESCFIVNKDWFLSLTGHQSPRWGAFEFSILFCFPYSWETYVYCSLCDAVVYLFYTLEMTSRAVKTKDYLNWLNNALLLHFAFGAEWTFFFSGKSVNGKLCDYGQCSTAATSNISSKEWNHLCSHSATHKWNRFIMALFILKD